MATKKKKLIQTTIKKRHNARSNPSSPSGPGPGPGAGLGPFDRVIETGELRTAEDDNKRFIEEPIVVPPEEPPPPPPPPPPVTPTWPDETVTGPTGALITVPGQATSGTGWAWNGSDGGIYTTGDNATIENLNVNGFIAVRPGDTGNTIRNCKVTIDADDIFGIHVEGDNTVVQDCEVVAPGGTDPGGIGINMYWIEAAGVTVNRCEANGGENSIMLSGINAIITNNYLHSIVREDVPGGPHSDIIQLFGGQACNGSLIRGNNCIAPTTWATSALIMGDNQNVTIDANRFRGAYQTVRLYLDDTNICTNNRIGGQSPVGGSLLLTDGGGSGSPTVSGNVNDDTGAPIGLN